MNNPTETDKLCWVSFLKKVLQFAVSFLAAFFVFFGLAFLLIFMSSGINGDNPSESRTESVQSTVLSQVEEQVHVLVVFVDEMQMFATQIAINKNKHTVNAVTVDTSGLDEVYENGGLYPFITECQAKAPNNPEYFLKINGESFVTITDRISGIVYNEADGNRVMLTGEQAKDMLSEQSFTEFCRQLTENVLKSNTKEHLLFIVNNSENNFSYSDIYTK